MIYDIIFLQEINLKYINKNIRLNIDNIGAIKLSMFLQYYTNENNINKIFNDYWIVFKLWKQDRTISSLQQNNLVTICKSVTKPEIISPSLYGGWPYIYSKKQNKFLRDPLIIKTDKYILCNIHGPHSNQLEYYKTLINVLNNYNSNYNMPIICGGDFNINIKNINVCNILVNQFINLINNNNYKIFNKGYRTHCKGGELDYVFTKKLNVLGYNTRIYNFYKVPFINRDHDGVNIILKTNVKNINILTWNSSNNLINTLQLIFNINPNNIIKEYVTINKNFPPTKLYIESRHKLVPINKHIYGNKINNILSNISILLKNNFDNFSFNYLVRLNNIINDYKKYENITDDNKIKIKFKNILDKLTDIETSIKDNIKRNIKFKFSCGNKNKKSSTIISLQFDRVQLIENFYLYNKFNTNNNYNKKVLKHLYLKTSHLLHSLYMDNKQLEDNLSNILNNKIYNKHILNKIMDFIDIGIRISKTNSILNVIINLIMFGYYLINDWKFLIKTPFGITLLKTSLNDKECIIKFINSIHICDINTKELITLIER